MTSRNYGEAIAIDAARISTDPFQQFISGYTNFGGGYIQMPFITKVAENLYMGGVESGLVLPAEIDFVLSLYKWKKYTKNHMLQDELIIEMHDSDEQDLSGIDELAEWVNRRRELGPVLVHCQAGLNRSGIVVARALMLNGDVNTGQEAINLLREKRSFAVLSNPTFAEWVRDSETKNTRA